MEMATTTMRTWSRQRERRRRSYFGPVGNGETVAFIGPDLAVDWLCLPRFDGYPIFARALDPRRGGTLTLTLGDGAPPRLLRQRYLGRTNILVTEGEADGLRIRTVDYMPWGRRHLTRRITVTNPGDQPREVWLAAAAEPTRSQAWPEPGPVALWEGRGPAVVTVPGAALAYGFRGTYGPTPRARLRLAPGQSRRLTLTVAYGLTPAEAVENWRSAPVDDLAAEQAFWRRWLAKVRRPKLPPGDLLEAYYRGLLAIKLVCHRETGAILAAPTASFPAVPGGHDNWDYRYVWIRDGYICARALDAAGLHEEARAFYEFCLRLQGPDGHWSSPLYTIDGTEPRELVAPDLSGPGGEQPVRFGNAAWDQLQLDSEPSIILGLYTHTLATGDWEYLRQRWHHVALAADAIVRLWREPENGIWEIRERRDHWIYGKALCAAGLAAAAEMAAALGKAQEAERWRAEAEIIREDVVTRGWDPRSEAYRQTYDPASPLDISALALSLWGLLPPNDPRLASTVRAMERPLRRPLEAVVTRSGTDTPFWGRPPEEAGGLRIDGGIARYDFAALPFYLPTLWMARHYLAAGRREDALGLARTCLDHTTDLGLMAEHFDPNTGEQWGNFPQAFNHGEMVLFLLEIGHPEGLPALYPRTWVAA